MERLDLDSYPMEKPGTRDLAACLPSRPALLVLDFDGVMTDNGVYVDENGHEFVRCSRFDGMGITLLRRIGFPVVVLSTETNAVVAARCRKLEIECMQALDNKLAAFDELVRQMNVDPADVVFVGNDVNDIGCLRRAGCGLVVADAHAEAKKAADAILSRRGGQGAVREVCDLILARLKELGTSP